MAVAGGHGRCPGGRFVAEGSTLTPSQSFGSTDEGVGFCPRLLFRPNSGRGHPAVCDL